MRRRVLGAVLVASCLALVAGCGGGDGGDDSLEKTDAATDNDDNDEGGGGTSSADDYAETVCTTLDGLVGSTNDLVDQYNALPSDDLAAFQGQVVQAVDGYLDEVRAAKPELTEEPPDVDDGEEIAGLFGDYVDSIVDDVQEARDSFAAADPNSPAFVADVTSFEVSFNVLTATLGDPFSQITDQEMLRAFDDEPSCEEIVTVF